MNSEISDDSNVFQQSDIQIPDRKSLGDKRSRNKNNTAQILPQIKHQPESNTLEENKTPLIHDINEISIS